MPHAASHMSVPSRMLLHLWWGWCHMKVGKLNGNIACVQDALAKKMTEAPHMAALTGILGFLFFVPLMLSLWRFALFGLN